MKMSQKTGKLARVNIYLFDIFSKRGSAGEIRVELPGSYSFAVLFSAIMACLYRR